MKAVVIRVLLAVPREDFDALLDPIRHAGGGIEIETIYSIEPVENMADALRIATAKVEEQRAKTYSDTFDAAWDSGYLEAVRDVAAFIEAKPDRVMISVEGLGRDLRSGAFFGAQNIADGSVDTSFTLDIESLCEGDVPDSVSDDDYEPVSE
jgi:hypothetical protein